MPLAREQRKLAAILAADVVGYSRLMGRDESGAPICSSYKLACSPDEIVELHSALALDFKCAATFE